MFCDVFQEPRAGAEDGRQPWLQHDCHPGYVSLLPLMVGAVDSDSPQVGCACPGGCCGVGGCFGDDKYGVLLPQGL